jgi:hypothetical protein
LNPNQGTNRGTVAICIGTVAPLPAAHLLIEPYSWRLFFYVVLSFALALFVLTVLFVEETSYDRKAHLLAEQLQSDESQTNTNHEKATTTPLEQAVTPSLQHEPISIPKRTPFIKTLSPWGRVDHSVPIFMTMARSFTYFLVPQVLWVVTSFGIYIGLGAFAFNYTFPIKITSPPYNWSEVSSVA